MRNKPWAIPACRHNKNTGQARSRGAFRAQERKKKILALFDAFSRASSASYAARASGDPSRAQAAMTRANISGDKVLPESGWWRRQYGARPRGP